MTTAYWQAQWHNVYYRSSAFVTDKLFSFPADNGLESLLSVCSRYGFLATTKVHRNAITSLLLVLLAF